MTFLIKLFQKLFFGVLFFALLLSCKTQKTISFDFTKEFAFTKGIEGPAVDGQGNLYAVNFKKEGTVGIVDKKGNASVFLQLPNASIGNGIRFDEEGNMYIADYVGHNIYRVQKGTKEPVVWAHHPKMNQPNDLTIGSNGVIYLSDPNWNDNSGNIWMAAPDGKIILLENKMGTTNGIEVSPDGRYLYVNESVQRKIWRYDIGADGLLSNKTNFLTFNDFGLDGMRCDRQGNLYVTRYGKGTVVIISPDKKIIKEVQLKGKKPSNITFGGKNGQICYVTMADRGCFEHFRALYPGAHFQKNY